MRALLSAAHNSDGGLSLGARGLFSARCPVTGDVYGLLGGGYNSFSPVVFTRGAGLPQRIHTARPPPVAEHAWAPAPPSPPRATDDGNKDDAAHH